MAGMTSDTLMGSLRELDVSRRVQCARHQLLDIITIAICDVICVADG